MAIQIFIMRSLSPYYLYLLVLAVPPPSVSVSHSSGTYAGTNFNLTCTIQLITAVDTPVVINSTWHGPLGVPAGPRVVASAPSGAGARYQTILMFRPLNTSDSGNYTCEVTVSPPPESQFISASTAGRDTLSVAVQGERILLLICCYLLTLIFLNTRTPSTSSSHHPSWFQHCWRCVYSDLQYNSSGEPGC